MAAVGVCCVRTVSGATIPGSYECSVTNMAVRVGADLSRLARQQTGVASPWRSSEPSAWSKRAFGIQLPIIPGHKHAFPMPMWTQKTIPDAIHKTDTETETQAEGGQA